jgi:hypothetical protein
MQASLNLMAEFYWSRMRIQAGFLDLARSAIISAERRE